MSDVSENVIKELQNTIGTLHTQFALLKAQAQELLDARDKEIAALKEKLGESDNGEASQ